MCAARGRPSRKCLKIFLYVNAGSTTPDTYNGASSTHAKCWGMCGRRTSDEDVVGTAGVQIILIDAVVALHSESSHLSIVSRSAVFQPVSGHGSSFHCDPSVLRKLWV